MRLKRLIIAAHPDDIVIGMAGTLLKEKHMYDVHALTLCCGRQDDSIVSRLHTDHTNLHSLNCKINQETFFDLTLDNVDNIRINKIIEDAISSLDPHEIYVINEDGHYDHKIVFKAVMTATRPKNRKRLKEIRAFELPIYTNQDASHLNGYEYVDISHEHFKKLEMIKKYDTENINIDEIITIQKLWSAQAGFNAKMFEKFKVIFKRS